MQRRKFLRLLLAMLGITQLRVESSAAPDNSGPNVTVWEGKKDKGEVDKKISIQASQFNYDPSVIKVRKGDRVRLYLTSTDVTHGFSLDGYPIDVDITPFVDKTVEFTATREGTFRFRCSHACGYFHPFMIGKLEVKPDTRFYSTLSGSFLVGLGVVGWLWKKVSESTEGGESGKNVSEK